MADRTLDVLTLQAIAANLELALASPHADVTRAMVRAALIMLQAVLTDRSTTTETPAPTGPPLPATPTTLRAPSPGTSIATDSMYTSTPGTAAAVSPQAAATTTDDQDRAAGPTGVGGASSAAIGTSLELAQAREAAAKYSSTTRAAVAAAASRADTADRLTWAPTLRPAMAASSVLPLPVARAEDTSPPPQYEHPTTGGSTDWLRAVMLRASAAVQPSASVTVGASGLTAVSPSRGTGSGGGVAAHVWSEGIRQFPDAGNNFHGRECANCGLRQYYGKAYGSNKHPGWSSVPAECRGSALELAHSP
jgi:hypothetical protein